MVVPVYVTWLSPNTSVFWLGRLTRTIESTASTKIATTLTSSSFLLPALTGREWRCSGSGSAWLRGRFSTRMLLRADRGVFWRFSFSGSTLDRIFSAGFSAGCVADFSAGCAADTSAGLRCANDAKADESCSDAVCREATGLAVVSAFSTEAWGASTGTTSLASDEDSGTCAALTIWRAFLFLAEKRVGELTGYSNSIDLLTISLY